MLKQDRNKKKSVTSHYITMNIFIKWPNFCKFKYSNLRTPSRSKPLLALGNGVRLTECLLFLFRSLATTTTTSDRLCPGGTGFSFGNNHYPDFASASWLAVSDLLNISFIQMVFRSTSLGLGHRTQRAGQGPVRGTEIWGLGSFSCDPTQLGPKYSNFPVCLKRSSYSLR